MLSCRSYLQATKISSSPCGSSMGLRLIPALISDLLSSQKSSISKKNFCDGCKVIWEVTLSVSVIKQHGPK